MRKEDITMVSLFLSIYLSILFYSFIDNSDIDKILSFIGEKSIKRLNNLPTSSLKTSKSNSLSVKVESTSTTGKQPKQSSKQLSKNDLPPMHLSSLMNTKTQHDVLTSFFNLSNAPKQPQRRRKALNVDEVCPVLDGGKMKSKNGFPLPNSNSSMYSYGNDNIGIPPFDENFFMNQQHTSSQDSSYHDDDIFHQIEFSGLQKATKSRSNATKKTGVNSMGPPLSRPQRKGVRGAKSQHEKLQDETSPTGLTPQVYGLGINDFGFSPSFFSPSRSSDPFALLTSSNSKSSPFDFESLMNFGKTPNAPYRKLINENIPPF